MKSNIFQIVLLLALIYSPSVLGVGQLFLNTVNPVKSDTVTFENDVFTYDGVVESLNTQTFQILKQYELNVQVPQIALNTEEALTINGALGTGVNSVNGDVAVGGNTASVSGHSISLNALQSFSVSSTNEDITFTSQLSTSILAAGANITTTSTNGINIVSAGDVDFNTNDELNVVASKFTASNQGDFTLDSERGGVQFASGSSFDLTADGQIEVNGILGVNYVTSGDLLVNADQSFVFAQAISNLAISDIAFTFSNTTVASEEDIKVWGDSVRIASGLSNIAIKAVYQYSDITLSADSDVILNSMNLVSLVSEGESGDVLIASNAFNLTAYSLTSTIGGDWKLGTQQTNNINLYSTASTFTLSAYYLDISASELVSINTTSLTYFNALGDIQFESNAGEVNADSTLSFTSYDFYLYSDIGDGSVALTATQSGISVSAQGGDASFSTFSLSGAFSGSQSYTINDNLLIQSYDDDVNVGASSSISITTSNLSITSFNAKWNATDLMTFDLNTIEFTSDNLDMLSNSTISFTALNSLYFSCGNTLNLESADFTLTASGTFSVTVQGSVTMETGNTLFNSGSIINILLSESFIADVTDLFSVSSNLFSLGSTNSYWESSNIVLSASQNITADSQSLFTGKFGTLTVDVANKALFDTQGAGNIQFISGENLSVSSLSLIDFSVSGTITFTAEETLTLSGNDTQILAKSISFSSNTGDQVVSGVDMSSKITGDTGFIGSDVSALADGAYTLQSKAGLSINGGDVSFSSGSNNQELSLTSVDSMSFATPTSPFTYEIVANERVLKINTDETFTTTSSGSVSYSSASLDFSSVNASMSASGSLTLQGSSATVNGDSSATVTSTDLSSFISGDDDYVKVSAKTNMTFTNPDSSFKIVGEGDVKFDAANDLSIEVGNAFSFTDRFVVKVAADNDLTVTATTNDLQIQSASSVNINNENQFDVLVRSYQNSINTFFSDFGIEANGIDNATECGVLLSAFMDGGSSQSYTSTDTLSILGDKCVEVRSFYSGSGVPSGDISLTSSGHVFYKSDTQGVTFLSNGVDDSFSVAAVYLKSNYGTVEVQSTRANITALANQGATFTSQNDFNVFGLRGVHMKSDGEAANINIRAGADSILEGARGLTLAAGTDAPSYAGDLTTSADGLLYIETFNNILIRSFSFVSDPNAILFNSQTNTEVTSNDGSGINFSAAGDMYMNAQSTISFSGSNGLVRFDADVDDMTMTAADLSWSTTRGPIGIEGRGSGSSVTFTTTNFTSSSYESSRFRALGSALITAATDLSLTSTDSTQCVLIQTERAYDSIYLNANEDFTLTINTNSPVYDQEHIIVSGNNIDIDAGNAVDFIQDSLFEIGRDSTPVVRVVAGGASAVGVSTTSVGSIEFISGGTFASSSVGDTTFDTTNFNVSSSGVITFDSQGEAISIVNDELFTVTADEILEIAPSDYTVTANEAITIQSNGNTPGDRIEFDSLTFVTFLGTGADTTFQYQFDLVTLTALDININTDNETVIANTGRYYWSYDLYSNPFDQLETELGLVNFISSNDLSITAVNASLSAVEEDLNVITNSDMIVTAPTIVSVNSNNELIFSGSSFNVSVHTITLNACDGCVTAFNGQSDLLPLYDSPLNQPSNQGDILFDAYTSITIDNQASTFQVSATKDIIFSSFDATSVTVGNDWAVTVSDATDSNLISFISQNDFSLQITANFDWTTDPAYYFVHQNNGKEFNASNSLSITTPSLTASSTNQNVNFIADQIVLGLNTAATALSFTYNSIYIQSEEQESPISWNVGSALDVQYTALAEFVATDRMSIVAGGAIDITDQQSYYRSYSGDVLFSTATINLTPTTTATVTASGYSSVNDAGIQVNGVPVTLTGPTTLIQGYKSNDFRTYGDSSSITFPSLQTLNLATTNFGSDIVFDSLGTLIWNADSFTATNDATVLSSANSLTVTATGALTLDSDLGRVEFTTKLIDQPSLLSLSSNTATNVVASEYLKISTVPVSSFNSQITLKSTGAASIMNIVSNVANGAGSSFEVTSEAGGILFSTQPIFTTPTTLTIDAGEVSLGSLTATLSATNALYDIQVDGDVLSDLYDFTSTGTILFQTNGARIENDISFLSSSSISFTGVGMDIYTEGYSSDILLYSPKDESSLSAAGSLNLEVSEGVRFLLTNNVGADTFTVSAGGVMTITAYDWEDSIFFQSDTEIVITSNEIRQATYNHRLGFFAQIPDFIHLVNLQARETCVRYGFCGYEDDGDNGGASFASRLANLDTITSDLQNALMALGLIEWHNQLVF